MQEFVESPQCSSSYSLLTSTEEIENLEVVQYGLQQIYVDRQGNLSQTKIKAISEEKQIVLNLINLLMEEEVPPSCLNDVVEEYITEQYSV